MRLQHTSGDQDSILTDCESFGGKAAEAAEVAEALDNQLIALDAQIEALESQIKDLSK